MRYVSRHVSCRPVHGRFLACSVTRPPITRWSGRAKDLGVDAKVICRRSAKQLCHIANVYASENKMDYKPEHAAQALAIMERLSPLVSPPVEYRELMTILREPHRWKEAHALFSKIRMNITLPAENYKKQDLNAYFAYVAENAAKTAYNCSECLDPFDEDSFEWLLKCEKAFYDRQGAIQCD